MSKSPDSVPILLPRYEESDANNVHSSTGVWTNLANVGSTFRQFQIIINVLVRYIRFIWIPMFRVYGNYIFLNYFSAGTNFGRQNLTSMDVRFWHLKTVPALKSLRLSVVDMRHACARRTTSNYDAQNDRKVYILLTPDALWAALITWPSSIIQWLTTSGGRWERQISHVHGDRCLLVGPISTNYSWKYLYTRHSKDQPVPTPYDDSTFGLLRSWCRCFIHFKLELLGQYPAANDEYYIYIYIYIYISMKVNIFKM